MKTSVTPLPPSIVNEFMALRERAIDQVSKKFHDKHADFFNDFGSRGVEACREDIGYTLDFLRPVLEFGLLQPFVDYLCWISEVLSSRGIPDEHVIQMLEWLAQFFQQEMPEGGVLISTALHTSKSAVKARSSIVSKIDQLMPEAWPEHTELMAALLAGDLKAARKVFESRISQGFTLLETEIHLVQPALYQVGREWQKNRVSVAQEHLATATAITLMAQAFTAAELASSNDKKVICACVEGNQHAVGLRMVSDGFELKGWEVIFLGPNVPTRDLIEHVKQSNPELVCLSVSMPDHLAVAKEVISGVRVAMGEKTPALMLGGLAINAFTTLAKLSGADATAPDAESVIAETNKNGL